MKKVYTTIALTLALCGSASAAFVQSQKMELQQRIDNVNINAIETATPVENNSSIRKEAAAANDVQGFYVYNYWGLSTGENYNHEVGIQVTIEGTDATISGVWEMADIKGTYNPTNGTIRVYTGQETFYTGELGTNINVYTSYMNADPNTGQILGFNALPYIDFEYFPAGAVATNGQTILIGGWYTDPMNLFEMNEAGYYGQNAGAYFWEYAMTWHSTDEVYNIPNFVFNASEWTKVEDATLTDGWVSAFFEEEMPSYKVACYQNIADPNQIVLANPYGKTSPFAQDNATPDAPGYIVLNIADPNCVVVRPFVNSGLNFKYFYGFYSSSNNPNDIFYPTYGFFAMTSKEGQYVDMLGYTTEDYIFECELYGDAIATYDPATHVVSLPECRVQGPYGDGYLYPSQWEATGGIPIPMEATVVLPELTGVEGITVDVPNAAKRYFNLQGVEIANPAQGEIVIVKEGNKASKVIF